MKNLFTMNEVKSVIVMQPSQKKKTGCQLVYCKSKHSLIWYFDDTVCPVCQSLSDQEEIQELTDEMETTLFDAASEINRLQGLIAELEDGI